MASMALVASIGLICFAFAPSLNAVPPHGDDQSLAQTLAQIKTLAKQDLSGPEYAAAVAKLVKDDPGDAEAIVAEAVKDKPPFACDVVKASLIALQPANGNLDPKVVASIVAAVVQNIESTNPDIVEQVISCALDVDKDAGPAILNALAGLFGGPHGINRPPGVPPGPPPGTGRSPTPTPTPRPTATPVTPFKPI